MIPPCFDQNDGDGAVAVLPPHGSHSADGGTAIEITSGPTVRLGAAIEGGAATWT